MLGTEKTPIWSSLLTPPVSLTNVLKDKSLLTALHSLFQALQPGFPLTTYCHGPWGCHQGSPWTLTSSASPRNSLGFPKTVLTWSSYLCHSFYQLCFPQRLGVGSLPTPYTDSYNLTLLQRFDWLLCAENASIFISCPFSPVDHSEVGVSQAPQVWHI